MTYADHIQDLESDIQLLRVRACLHANKKDITLDNEWKHPATICCDCGSLLSITIIDSPHRMGSSAPVKFA
jgi:hypothetical protein